MRALLLLLAGLLLGTTAWAQDPAPKDRVLNGDAKCTRCHDENDSFPVLAIAKTKHGTRADARTPTCTSCHGESESHINKPASGARPKHDITFSKTSRTPICSRRSSSRVRRYCCWRIRTAIGRATPRRLT